MLTTALQEIPLPGGGWAPRGLLPTLGTLLSVAEARGAHQGADCGAVSAGAVPDGAAWGNPELGTKAMSGERRGGRDAGGRLRVWATWAFGHSLLGEEDTPEIITGVLRCSSGVSGTPAQGCIQERAGKRPSSGTTEADEPGDSQSLPKER